MKTIGQEFYILLLLLLVLFPGSTFCVEKGECSRIITLAPSLTEIVFELGLGKNLVGVSRYDAFPKEVSHIPRVGGLLDLNLEALLSLRPSLVLALREHKSSADRIKKMGLQVSQVSHDSISDIRKSISSIGALCGRDNRAAQLLSQLDSEVAEIRSQIPTAEKLRTLVVIRGGKTSGAPRPVYISGGDGFYSELLELAGAKNVYEGETIAMPMLSFEGLEVLNPAVIIEILPATQDSDPPVRAAPSEVWARFQSIEAIAHGRVYQLSASHMSIPGPRYAAALRDMALVLWRSGQVKGESREPSSRI